MEVNQFNGNFMAPGNTTKHQPDVLNMAWGLPGSAEAVAFKSVSVDHLQQLRHAPNQPQRDRVKQDRPGASQSQEARDGREGKTRQTSLAFSVLLFLWTLIGASVMFKPRLALHLHLPRLPLLHISVLL